MSAQDAAAEDADASRFDIEADRPKDARALFELFAKLDGLEVSFEEEKQLQLLFEPLTSKGKLYYLRGGYLTRVVLKPKPQSVHIGPKELRIRGEKDEEVIDLGQNESVRVFVTSLVRVFSGDEKRLREFYDVEYVHSIEKDKDGRAVETPDAGGPWTLTLTPKGKPLSEMVKGLRIRGRGTLVQGIEIREPNGDRTRTRITASNPKRKFTPKERKELFGLEPQKGSQKGAQKGPQSGPKKATKGAKPPR